MKEYKIIYQGNEITFTDEWFGTEDKKFYFKDVKNVKHIDSTKPYYEFRYNGTLMQFPCDKADDEMLYPFFFKGKSMPTVPNRYQVVEEGNTSTYLNIIEGKSGLNMTAVTTGVTIRQTDDGYVAFNTIPGHEYSITHYEWSGASYKSVTVEQHKGGIKSKGTSKRHGGLLGAVVGGAVTQAPVGAIIGYSATSKTKTKGKTKDRTKVYSETKDIELPTPATMTVVDRESGETFSFVFKCTTKIDLIIKQLCQNEDKPRIESTSSPEQLSESNIISLLKEYKELLDMGVITEEEFNNKKAVLLNK